MNKQLAKISKASLEIQERGILNFWIHVNYEVGCSQGIGGISLDQWDEKLQRRVGTAYGCEMVRRLLLTMQVNDFSEMTGKNIWVLGDGAGLSFNPKGIQLLHVDDSKSEPFIFKHVADEFIGENHE